MKYDGTFITDMLDRLASEGPEALHRELRSSAESAESAEKDSLELDEMFLLAQAQDITDLRDERIQLLFASADCAQVARGILSLLNAWQPALTEEQVAAEELAEARHTVQFWAGDVRSLIRCLNDACDEEEYLCGVGIHAATGTPRVTRAADDLIYSRARYREALARYKEAGERLQAAKRQVAFLRPRVALIIVGSPGAIDLS